MEEPRERGHQKITGTEGATRIGNRNGFAFAKPEPVVDGSDDGGEFGPCQSVDRLCRCVTLPGRFGDDA